MSSFIDISTSVDKIVHSVDRQLARYLFITMILTMGDPDLMDGIIAFVGSWS